MTRDEKSPKYRQVIYPCFTFFYLDQILAWCSTGQWEYLPCELHYFSNGVYCRCVNPGRV